MEPTSSAEHIWQAVLGELQLSLQRPIFDNWLRETSFVAYEDGCFVVAAKNAFAQDWLENRMKGMIKSRLQRACGRSVDVRFVVRPDPVAVPAVETTSPLLDPMPENGQYTAPGPVSNFGPSLNSSMTFEAFIEGEGNRFAHAAAQAVAQDPGTRYNPLFLYGGVGLGKTHLLHAIGNRAASKGYVSRYVTSETFTNDLIEAIRTKTNVAFRQTYRELDVLLIDDIQFIEGKDSTQTEFFHTFNSLYATNKQIVIASDRPPRALLRLEERLRSRFDGGLTADLQPPDLEHRIAILRSKAYERGIAVPETVLRFIADRYSSNVRELQGALNQVVAYAQHHRTPLDVDLARRLLTMEDGRLANDPDSILLAIADEFRVTVSEIKGPRRSKRYIAPRQMAMFVLRDLAQLSFPQIGEIIGGRDHSTAMHGIDKMSDILSQDAEMRHRLERVRVRLRS